MERTADKDEDHIHAAIGSGVCILAAAYQNRTQDFVEN
jgi:hypothetical protein